MFFINSLLDLSSLQCEKWKNFLHPCLSYLIIVLFWEVGETCINVSAVLFCPLQAHSGFSPGLWLLPFCCCLNLNLCLVPHPALLLEISFQRVRQGHSEGHTHLSVIGRTKGGVPISSQRTPVWAEVPHLPLPTITYHHGAHAAAPFSALQEGSTNWVSVLCCTVKEPSSLWIPLAQCCHKHDIFPA